MSRSVVSETLEEARPESASRRAVRTNSGPRRAPMAPSMEGISIAFPTSMLTPCILVNESDRRARLGAGAMPGTGICWLYGSNESRQP